MRAELRKLVRPAVVLVLIVGPAAGVASAAYGQEFAVAQLSVAEFVRSNAIEHQLGCQKKAQSARKRCADGRAADVRQADALLRSSELQAAAAETTQRPLGAVTLVSGLYASALGFLLAFALAALSVAGEWSSRTASIQFSVALSYRRFFLAKVATVWIALIASFAFGALLLAVVGGLNFQDAFPLQTAEDPFHGLAFALERVGIAAIALGLFAALAVALGMLFRSPLTTLGVGLGALLLLNLPTPAGPIGHLLPGGLISNLARFGDTPAGYFDHLWFEPIGVAPSLVLSLVVSTVVMAAIGLALARRISAADRAL